MGGRGSSAGAGSAAFERKNFGKSNVSFKETELNTESRYQAVQKS